jgi:hypothetical protein
MTRICRDRLVTMTTSDGSGAVLLAGLLLTLLERARGRRESDRWWRLRRRMVVAIGCLELEA